MAIKTEGGVTVLTPTAWKWYVAAAFTFFLFPPFSMAIALFFILTGAGITQRLTLSKDGIKIRNMFSDKSYRWDEMEDFRIYKVKSGLFTAANMVSFTHANQQGTMVGKAAKFLAGGTHSIPAVGVKAQKLVLLMQAYKGGHVIADTPVEAVTPVENVPALEAPLPPIAAARARHASQAKPAAKPRAVPATPRAQRKAMKPKGNFGTKGRSTTPLVQDGGGLFGRRRPDTPFSN